MSPLQLMIYWKMFWFRLLLSTGSIVALALCAGLSGVDNFSGLETTQKIIIIASIAGIICTNTVSLLDKTYASLSSNGKTLGDITNGGNGNGGSPSPSQPNPPPSLGK